MATRIAWLLNLDCALELERAGSYEPGRLAAARLRELCEHFTDLVAPEDFVVDGPEPLSSLGVAADDLTGLAFCATPSALHRLSALGVSVPEPPPLPVLARVNDRAFCAELGHGLPGARFVRDMETLLSHLQTPSFTGSHVIKRALSFAGSGKRRVHAGVLDESTRGFCVRSFSRGQGLQVEPWVQRIVDFSRHGYLARSGELLIGEVRTQRCDEMGRFVGVDKSAPELLTGEDQALRAEVKRTGAALQAAGYFGPFGIDAFRYVGPDGAPTLCTRCEINARFTMGYPRELLLRGLGL